MLAGHKRIQLLRQLYEKPGRSVSALGQAVAIKRSCASQELRRIQSRGLLKAQRKGRPLIYRLDADPQVSSAKPLLQAIRNSFAAYPPHQDHDMCTIANGLAHERRIAIARILQNESRFLTDLQALMHLSAFALDHHLRPLAKAGLVTYVHDRLCFQIPVHPLARTLAKLLNQSR